MESPENGSVRMITWRSVHETLCVCCAAFFRDDLLSTPFCPTATLVLSNELNFEILKTTERSHSPFLMTPWSPKIPSSTLAACKHR